MTRSMAKRLFVGGLSWTITEDGLREAFARFGEVVEAEVVANRRGGSPRGFGYVTLASDESATAAVSEMHGSELDGQSITVAEAKQRRSRSREDDMQGQSGRRW